MKVKKESFVCYSEVNNMPTKPFDYGLQLVIIFILNSTTKKIVVDIFGKYHSISI